MLNDWYNLPHVVDALIQISHINLNLTPADRWDISGYLRLQAAAWWPGREWPFPLYTRRTEWKPHPGWHMLCGGEEEEPIKSSPSSQNKQEAPVRLFSYFSPLSITTWLKFMTWMKKLDQVWRNHDLCAAAVSRPSQSFSYIDTVMAPIFGIFGCGAVSIFSKHKESKCLWFSLKQPGKLLLIWWGYVFCLLMPFCLKNNYDTMLTIC